MRSTPITSRGTRPATTMDQERCWHVIAAERRSLADLLDALPPADWDAPSRCAGWRVRDVAAHVAMAPQPPSFATMVRQWARARGSFDRLNHDLAVRHADSRVTDRIVADLRQFADSRRLPVVTNYRNVLLDTLVHGQDIAIPLGRRRSMPRDAAGASATRVWTMGWPFWARRRLRAVRLEATDAEWAVGAGAPIRGPIDALLLLLTGRVDAVTPRLSGEGLRLLAKT